MDNPWAAFGFKDIPTERELAVRTSLHNTPSANPDLWAERNIALLRRRSLRGGLAQFVGQLEKAEDRKHAVEHQDDIAVVLHAARSTDIQREQGARIAAPPETIMEQLSRFQQRFLRLLWEHEGEALSHTFINAHNPQERTPAKNSLFETNDSAARKVRSLLREERNAIIYSMEAYGQILMSHENARLPFDTLDAMSGQNSGGGGMHALNFNILNSRRPDTVPYNDFFDAYDRMGREAGALRDPQGLSQVIRDMNRFAGDPPHFHVQGDYGKGYRLLTWNELPQPWIRFVEQEKLLTRETDLLVHFLTNMHRELTVEEVVILTGKPNQKTHAGSSIALMNKFSNRMKDRLPIRSNHLKQKNSAVTGYTCTVPPELIACPTPLQEIYLRARAMGQIQHDPALERMFQGFDPAVYGQLAEKPQAETRPAEPPVFVQKIKIGVPKRPAATPIAAVVQEEESRPPEPAAIVEATAEPTAAAEVVEIPRGVIETVPVTRSPDPGLPVFAQDQDLRPDDPDWLNEQLDARLMPAVMPNSYLRNLREYLYNWDGKGAAGYHLQQMAGTDVADLVLDAELRTDDDTLEYLRFLIYFFGHDPRHTGTNRMLDRVKQRPGVDVLIRRLWANDIARQNIAWVARKYPDSELSGLLFSAIEKTDVERVEVLPDEERAALTTKDDIVAQQQTGAVSVTAVPTQKEGLNFGKKRRSKVLDPEQMIHTGESDTYDDHHTGELHADTDSIETDE